MVSSRPIFIPHSHHLLHTFHLPDPSTPYPWMQSRAVHGRNELPADEGTPFYKLVLKQFDDYLVKILIAAAVVDLLIALANGERGAGCAGLRAQGDRSTVEEGRVQVRCEQRHRVRDQTFEVRDVEWSNRRQAHQGNTYQSLIPYTIKTHKP